jgi:hypothetical protein
MPRKKNPLNAHTGHTLSGHTRDVKVERVGKITIYKRGDIDSLSYRQGVVSQRRKVDGNISRRPRYRPQGGRRPRREPPLSHPLQPHRPREDG